MNSKDLRKKGILSHPYPENLLCLLFENEEIPVLDHSQEEGLAHVLSTLPAIHQECINCIFKKKMTYVEISKILFISKQTISDYKGYAIESLRYGRSLNYIRYGYSIQTQREQAGYGQFRMDVLSTPVKELSLSQALKQALYRHNIFSVNDLVQLAQSTDILFLEELGLKRKAILVKQVLIPLNDYLTKNRYDGLLPENLSVKYNTNYYRDMKKDDNLIKKFDNDYQISQ